MTSQRQPKEQESTAPQARTYQIGCNNDLVREGLVERPPVSLDRSYRPERASVYGSRPQTTVYTAHVKSAPHGRIINNRRTHAGNVSGPGDDPIEDIEHSRAGAINAVPTPDRCTSIRYPARIGTPDERSNSATQARRFLHGDRSRIARNQR